MRPMQAAVIAALGWMGGTAAMAAAPTQVTLKPVDGGVEAVFALSEPVASVAFDDRVDRVRQDGWRVTTPGVILKDGIVARPDGAPISGFTVRISPDSASRDRTYPGLTRVGEGWQLYGPYLYLKDLEVQAHVALPTGWTLAPAAASTFDPKGHLFIGPAAYVAEGASTVVSPPEVSAKLKTVLREASERALQTYGRRLGARLPTSPTLIVARVPQFNCCFQGDTTDGPSVSMRFFGEGWEDPSPKQVAGAVRFVDHEYFHLWNSRLAHSRDMDGEAWLHEGMAEYASVITAAADGAIDEATAREELSGRLAGCARRMKTGLSVDAPSSGEGVYDCGVLAQWIADLNGRATRRDIFDVWRGLLSRMVGGRREYDAAAFVAAAATDAGDDPLRRLMGAKGTPLDWAALVAAMNARGAVIEPGRSAAEDRRALVMHLERQVCAGGLGFYSYEREIKLDTGDRCGPLNGDPRVDAVAGFNLITDPSSAFDAVAALCASGREAIFTYQGQPVGAVTCKTTLPSPLVWTVKRR